MNKLYRFLERILNIDGVTVEESPITTESIRKKIERSREEDAERDAQVEEYHDQLKEKLKTFPIGLPASVTEIALSYDEFDLSLRIVLDKLVRTDGAGWEYVNIDGCTHYQRVTCQD